MELLSSRVNLSRECSGKNVGKMSTIVGCKRKLQFHVVKFDQGGNVLSSKRPRFASDEQDKRNGKGKENTIPTTVCDRSYATHQQVQPQAYRFIAPRPAASRTSIQQSILPFQNSAYALENITEKLMENPKPVETPVERSYVFSTTSSNRLKIDWIERVKTFISSKAPHFKVSSWKSVDGDYCTISKTDLSRYDSRLVLVPGVAPVSLHVSADGNYAVKVLFRDTTWRGTLKEEEDISSLLAVMENCEVCPGLKSVPNANSASKRTWGFPFERIDSNKCLLLHLPANKKQIPGSVLFNVCKHCKKLYQKLNYLCKKRRKNEANRVSKSSKCNLRFLSPKSAKKRFHNLTSDARRLSKDVKRLSKKVQVSLNSELSDQMEQITSKISSQFHEDLDGIFEEAEVKTKGNGKLLKAMWQQDVDEKKAFWKDQSQNGRHSKHDFMYLKKIDISCSYHLLHTSV